jgi:hypothetical protein
MLLTLNAERLFVNAFVHIVHIATEQGKVHNIYHPLSNHHLKHMLLTLNVKRQFVQPIVNAHVHIGNKEGELMLQKTLL